MNFLFSSPRLGRKRTRAITVTTLALTSIVAIVLLVPIPLGTRAEGVIWIPEQSFVRAGTDGFVERLVAVPGTHVQAGDPLLECSDPLLPAHIRVLESQLRQLKALYDTQMLSDLVQAEITEEEIEHVTAQLADARERAGELTIRSSVGGTFLVPMAQDLPGRFIRRGELLGYVVDRSIVTCRVVVSQSDVDMVRQRTEEVNIRFPERVAETIPALLKREVPAATDQLPGRALSHEGGGEIAIDPRDILGVKTFQKVFLFDLELPAYAGLLNVGGRVYVRFDHGQEPLVWRWYRSARQLFLRRFNV